MHKKVDAIQRSFFEKQSRSARPPLVARPLFGAGMYYAPL